MWLKCKNIQKNGIASEKKANFAQKVGFLWYSAKFASLYFHSLYVTDKRRVIQIGICSFKEIIDHQICAKNRV